MLPVHVITKRVEATSFKRWCCVVHPSYGQEIVVFYGDENVQTQNVNSFVRHFEGPHRFYQFLDTTMTKKKKQSKYYITNSFERIFQASILIIKILYAVPLKRLFLYLKFYNFSCVRNYSCLKALLLMLLHISF